MDLELAQKAINAALNGEWKEAVEVNSQILGQEPNNLDALNRLARAYSELGEIGKAKKASQKVLKIDPFNGIAVKSLKKWQTIKDGQKYTSSKTAPWAFLEEPGKTKMISLIHLGDPKVIANIDCGDQVVLTPHSHSVSVITNRGKYVGKLPDDLAIRFINLMKNGGQYQTFIKSAEPAEVRIFIRGLFV